MRYIGIIILAMVMWGCAAGVPKEADLAGDMPSVYPDYSGATVPPNIAPLNFEVKGGNDIIVRASAPCGKEIVAKGNPVQFDIKDWHALLAQAKGDSVSVDVYEKVDGKWGQYSPFQIYVAEQDVDPYIAYRLIEPGYEGFETMGIYERCLENFEQRELFNNRLMASAENGQCINCHSFQDYNSGGCMQMHARINNGGTLIIRDGEAAKVNLKTPETISGGVYPSWHPTLPLIAYSVNTTNQSFHSRDLNKVEVQDDESDLILYDIDNNEVSIISNDPQELETFPYWNHDGTALYYVSARLPEFASQEERMTYRANNYQDYKYNIYRRPFDAETKQFGPVDTVFMASELGMSATHPRESRDGKYLLFTMAEYGTFHIWHRDADLYMLDLQSGEIIPADALNSGNVESYHSWSSMGDWVVFSSRRDDGSYTRLYIAHYNGDGTFGKPFLLPQREPAQNKALYKSYNVPEFMMTPAPTTPSFILKSLEQPAKDACLAN